SPPERRTAVEATSKNSDGTARPIESPASVPALGSKEKQALILLAEDNEENIKMVSDYLLVKGYRLSIARNGGEAIERAKEERPDLILMDIQMPGMNGIEATR